MGDNIIIEFNKRFANGEQDIELHKDVIVTKTKDYFWQSSEIFNHILPIVDYLKNKYHNITEEELYGENGIVSLLIPVQRAYNSVMNRNVEYANRLAYPSLLVEDGSVDIDSLDTEGLAPGKIIVYRQGAIPPKPMVEVVDNSSFYLSQQEILLKEFNIITELFEKRL